MTSTIKIFPSLFQDVQITNKTYSQFTLELQLQELVFGEPLQVRFSYLTLAPPSDFPSASPVLCLSIVAYPRSHSPSLPPLLPLFQSCVVVPFYFGASAS